MKLREVLEFIQEKLSAVQFIPEGRELEHIRLYEKWNDNKAYSIGDIVQYDGRLFRCLQAHNSQFTWNPIDAVSLWAEILPGQDGEIGEWKQPDSTNTYMKGQKVTHNGKIWESNIDYNSYEPGAVGVYTWDEVTE